MTEKTKQDNRGENDLERKLEQAEKVITSQEIEIKELIKENDHYRDESQIHLLSGGHNFKPIIDHYKNLDKKELIERLTIKNAQLLKAEKEVDRLNEEIQLMEIQSKNT